VAASRAICPAVGSPGSNSRALIAAGLSAAKIAAPTGLVQRMCAASTLQSHAGSALVASGASRLSRRNDSWISDARMLAVAPSRTRILTMFCKDRARLRPSEAGALKVQSRDNLNPTRPLFSLFFARLPDQAASSRMIA
jgi:hypothetical protein